MKDNAKDSPVSVRFGAVVSASLDRISQQTGIGKAEIIRRATEDYLAKVEAEGRLVIPLVTAERSESLTINHNGHGPTKYKITRQRK